MASVDGMVASILAETPPNPNFATEEDTVLAFWEKTGAFKKQLELSQSDAAVIEQQ